MAGPSTRVAAVGVGDRLALDTDLLAADGNGLGDLLLDHVLLQPHAAGLALGRTDPQLLLGARHRVVGGRPARVVARRVAAGGVADGEVAVAAVAIGRAVIVARVAAVPVAVVAAAVVLVEVLFLVARERAVGVDVGRVLDLVLGVAQPHFTVGELRIADRDERRPRAEQAGADRHPFRLLTAAIEVDLIDRADLVAVGVDGLRTAPLLNVGNGPHGGLLEVGQIGRTGSRNETPGRRASALPEARDLKRDMSAT